MTDLNVVVNTLRDCGLTRTEAETYLATLQEFKNGPVSGYRVAQSLGKDPANLSKTLTALEKVGAVRPIQEKPRLYVPVPPEEFTDKLMADLKANRSVVLAQLEDLEITIPRGIPMALHSRETALQKAAQLLTRCRRELLIFADGEILIGLGTALEALAVSSEVSVNLLCIEEIDLPGINSRLIELPVGFSDPQPVPWLQMVVDRQTWLVASFPSVGADKAPCGWWSQDPSMALVMGAGLAAAWDGRVDVSVEVPPVESMMETEIEAEEPAVEPLPEPVFEPMTETMAAPVQEEESTEEEVPLEAEVEEAAEEDQDEGIQFIIRHEDDDDAGKES